MADVTKEDAVVGATRRDAAMIALVAHAQGLITRLAMLTRAEREAVLALVVVGEAAAHYARGAAPDGAVIESYARLLESLSPEGMQRLAPHIQAQIRHQVYSSDAEGLGAQLRALHAALEPASRRVPNSVWRAV